MIMQQPIAQEQQLPMRITSSNVEQLGDVTVEQEAQIRKVNLNTEERRPKELQELAVSAGTAASIGTVLTRSQELKSQVPKS